MSDKPNLPQVVAINDAIVTVAAKTTALPEAQRSQFNEEFARRLKEFQDKMLQAFPDAEFTVIGWAKNAPVTLDIGGNAVHFPDDSSPEFYVDVNVPMFPRRRNSTARKLAGRLVIYDERNPHRSLYHQVLYWLKGVKRG